jgi:hypothetical protein
MSNEACILALKSTLNEIKNVCPDTIAYFSGFSGFREACNYRVSSFISWYDNKLSFRRGFTVFLFRDVFHGVNVPFRFQRGKGDFLTSY